MTVYEAIGTVATSMGVNYLYGSLKEIQQRLLEQYNDPATRNTRYPCLCLITSGLEGDVQISGDIDYDCTIVFLMSTEKNYTTAQRLENVYKVTLYPMVVNFFKYLRSSKYIGINFETGYKQTDAFFYPSTPAEEQNTMSAFLDAIEIKNLKITLFKTC